MLAYLNGKILPYDQATLPVWDFGFTMGVTVTEQLRTFAGKIHLLEDHLTRLRNGLEIVGIKSPVSFSDLSEIAQQLVEENAAEIPSGSDMNLGICFTPGASANATPADFEMTGEPTVLVYTRELSFANWANHYAAGISLSTVDYREIPDACVPSQLKCRSRMHYYLAEKQAREKHAGSRALLLNMDGNVAESTIASIVMCDGETMIAPPPSDVLPGVSLQQAERLAAGWGIKLIRRDIAIDELKNAKEVMWLSTSVCALPVTRIDGTQIGQAKPGPLFSKLIQTWSDEVKVDIIQQAQNLGR